MAERKSGDICDAARSRNEPKRSNSISEIAPSTAGRPHFVIIFTPAPGADAIRSLRLLLKRAKRAFGLIAVAAYEDRSSPLQISNKVADEFRELADEVIAESAQAWRRP
jgi:hypothetical protein